MNKRVNISLLLNVLCLAGIVYLLTAGDGKKTAFFLNAEVYNEFTYKKELELDLEQIQSSIKKTMDSLQLDLQLANNYLESITPSEDQLILFERKKNNYFQTQQEVEGAYGEKVQEYYNLIWNRINEYVKEYGEANGYTYVFGANGDGTVMYADESEDITEEIIEHINKKYAGV